MVKSQGNLFFCYLFNLNATVQAQLDLHLTDA